MLYFDAEQCTECQACRLKCSFVKEGEYNPDKARLNILGSWPQFPVLKVCRQCKKPACIKACPVNALTQNETRAILIDFNVCTQCGLCVTACPFDAVLTLAGRIHICDTCKGEYPCVKVCSTGAISRERRST